MNKIESHLNEIWWLLMLRAIALVLFGVITIIWPGLTFVALAAAFAIYLLIAGVVDIISGIRAQGRRSLWFLTMLLGLAEIGLAVYIFKHGLVLATFIAVLSVALIVIGLIEVIAAFEPGEDAGRRFLLIIGGGLALVSGFIVLRYPVSSGLAFAWVLGAWGLISGAMQIAMCLSLRSHLHDAAKELSA